MTRNLQPYQEEKIKTHGATGEYYNMQINAKWTETLYTIGERYDLYGPNYSGRH